MNRLLQKAPNTVLIGGVEYPINTSHRDCLLTVMGIEDESTGLLQSEKVEIVLDNLYKKVAAPSETLAYNEFMWPVDVVEAQKQALWFLSGGRESTGKTPPKTFDYDFDSERIYSAFLVAGIDLDKEMHWWTFLSRFSELPEDTSFSQIIQLRYKHAMGKLDKEDKKVCAAIGWDIIRMQKSDVTEAQHLEFERLLSGE